MSANVHAEIAQRSVHLADKLSSNNDLSNMILALLSRLIVMCQQRVTSIEGLRLSPMDTRYHNNEFVISTHLTFHPIAVHPPAFWRPQTDFEAFTAARAQGLAAALRRNPDLGRFFQGLVEKIDGFATHKSLHFSRLRILNPFISKDDVLVIGVGKDSQ